MCSDNANRLAARSHQLALTTQIRTNLRRYIEKQHKNQDFSNRMRFRSVALRVGGAASSVDERF